MKMSLKSRYPWMVNGYAADDKIIDATNFEHAKWNFEGQLKLVCFWNTILYIILSVYIQNKSK